MPDSSSLKEKLERLHTLEPLPAVDRGWRFTAKTAEGPAIHAVRLGSADDHVALLQCSQGFDPLLVQAIFNHVGDVRGDFFDEEPVRVLSEFSCPGWGFDRIVAVGPLAHTKFEAASPELQECTVELFPAYACEFKGDEDGSLVRTLRKYFVETLNWARAPQPRLLMMHRNALTKSRSPGQKRGLARLDKCFRELDTLPEDADSFIELENISGQVIRIVRDAERYRIQRLESAASAQLFNADGAKAYVQEFLTRV